MNRESGKHAALVQENRELRARLEEAEAMLDALLRGKVDVTLAPAQQATQGSSLQQREGLYQTLIENMDQGAALTSRDATIVYCNRFFASMLNAPQERVMGTAIWNWVATEDRTRLEMVMENSGQSYAHGEIQLMPVGGGGLPAFIAVSPMAAPGMDLLGWIVSDLSEQKLRTAEMGRLLEEAQHARVSLLSLLEDQQNMMSRLKQREQDLQQFFNNSPDTIYVYDLLSQSTSFLNRDEFLGYTPEDMLQSGWHGSAVHPDEREQVREYIQQMNSLRQSQVVTYDYRLRKKNGGWEWVTQRSTLLDPPEDPVSRRLLVTFSIITSQKEAEQALRRSEEQYRGLMESLDSAVALVATDGALIYINEICGLLIGLEPEQIAGKYMEEVFPVEMFALRASMIAKLQREDRAMQFDEPIFRADSLRWYRTSLIPLHDDDGAILSVLINSVDVTEMKLLQNELQQLNRDLEIRVERRTVEVRELYENAPSGYHSLDGEGNYSAVNQTELNWLGYCRDELIGQPFSALLSPQSRPDFELKFQRFRMTGKMENLEYELLRKDGSSFFVLINSEAIYDAEHTYISSRSTMVDITERKQVEDALRLVNLKLEEAMRVKDEFLASMSHELRTPLTGILGLSEALQLNTYGELTPYQQRSVGQIYASGKHLLELINDVLDLSKIQADRLELDCSVIAASDVCQASLQLVRGLARQKDIKVSFDIDPPSFAIYVDGRRVKQMLVNLLSNAIKFTPAERSVGLIVRVDALQKQVHFTVWDTGIGIEPDAIRKLFKPFVQLDSRLNRTYSGTGLGLALVKSMAELHGGSVGVESVLGTGSRFTITLPWDGMTVSDTPPDLEALLEESQREALARPQARKTLLIIDDTEDMLVMFHDFFEYLGYRVETASNGKDGLVMVNRTQPDLILMDVQMPEIDGLMLTRMIRGYASFRETPIIALTALAMPGDRERCMEAGMDDYVSKPVSMKALAEVIQRYFRD